ncbi:hypothetical protein HBI46_173170 [Parastagonospora nodorum]|nr:hypothetical protein HBI46_173170 [Parastagonospora nodorum]
MEAAAVQTFFNVTSPLQHAITIDNSWRSPLLRLPSELRNRIYDYVLGGVYWNLTDVAPPRGPLPPPLRSPETYGALLRVSRQIFIETATLPFSLGSFQAWDKPASVRFTAMQWSAITSLVFYVSWSVTIDWAMGWCITDGDFEFLDTMPHLQNVLVNVTDFYGEKFREQNRRNGQMAGPGTMTKKDLVNWLNRALNTNKRRHIKFRVGFCQ